jgi:hypothetical protein
MDPEPCFYIVAIAVLGLERHQPSAQSGALIEVRPRHPKTTVFPYKKGASMSKDNPLRPRLRRSPKKILSEGELQRYGLRRMRNARRETSPRQGPVDGTLKKLSLLVWNGPAILLTRLARFMRTP